LNFPCPRNGRFYDRPLLQDLRGCPGRGARCDRRSALEQLAEQRKPVTWRRDESQAVSILRHTRRSRRRDDPGAGLDYSGSFAFALSRGMRDEQVHDRARNVAVRADDARSVDRKILGSRVNDGLAEHVIEHNCRLPLQRMAARSTSVFGSFHCPPGTIIQGPYCRRE